ncbi:hypothetical protein RRG08_047436 [Elysia crispata]|uniref:Uncharacterized protein n=1 Tax=Elysia crispata TaxID=231223 RepID=A0AAE1D577_9GAST|nr:hypothetical protein RRG08_047436 [Elysia crispata]
MKVETCKQCLVVIRPRMRRRTNDADNGQNVMILYPINRFLSQSALPTLEIIVCNLNSILPSRGPARGTQTKTNEILSDRPEEEKHSSKAENQIETARPLCGGQRRGRSLIRLINYSK